MRLTQTKEDPTPTTERKIDDPSDFLTVDELMSETRVGRTAAYSFARQHGIRIGRLLRVPREALKG